MEIIFNIFNTTFNGYLPVIAIVIVALFAQWYILLPKDIPPGPIKLPLVGYFPFLGPVPHLTFKKLGQKYGSIFSVFMGNQLVVILNDYKAVHEAFVKKADIFAGRPFAFKDSFPVKTFKSLTTSDGQFWKEHRAFTQSLFKEYGVGKTDKEMRILEEIQRFIAEINKLEGQPFDIREKIVISIANNICIMVLGKSFGYTDEQFLKFHHLLHEMVKSKMTLPPLLFFPWIKYVPGIRYLLKYDKLKKMQDEAYEFLQKRVDDERITYTEGQRDNYITAYLTEQARRNKEINQTNGSRHSFSDHALLSNLRSFMIAGTETTTDTLLWAIVYMLNYPEIQKKIQEELDKVIGFERNPAWNDRLRTPYTEATICEVQRITDLIPLNLPHRNREECQILGYRIPKDTIIVSNVANVHTDPTYWIDPEQFCPERFLNSRGELEKPDYFIPFSTGKRQCLGEIIAKMELYLYFTSILQRFTLKPSNGNFPSVHGYMSGTHIPNSFEVLFIARHKDD